jgi:hypothetical protein
MSGASNVPIAIFPQAAAQRARATSWHRQSSQSMHDSLKLFQRAAGIARGRANFSVAIATTA